MEQSNQPSVVDRLPYVEITSEIVSAYVANNPVPAAELAALIENVYKALSQIAVPAPDIEVLAAQKPAVNPKKSVFEDYIICLDDGKQFKSLKRHLSLMGMTPDEYRQKWNLPYDYPMVAPGYARQRSELAKAIGLGQKRSASKKGSKRAKAA